ncbi:hypothetical protein LINGRAHAP2_LOCUS33426 [Linum grandiflorum]
MYHPDTHFDTIAAVVGGRPSTSTASSSSSSLLAAAIKDSTTRSFTGKQRNPHSSRSLARPVHQQWQQKKTPAAAQEETLVLGSTTHWTMYSCLGSRPADFGNRGGFDFVGVESFLLKKDKKCLAEQGGKGAIFNGKSGFERRPPLKVQMVDDTVLIDSTDFQKRISNNAINWKRGQSQQGGAHYQDAKKTNKMPRREGKDSGPEAGNGTVIKKYSREEMEGMRFADSGEQQMIWRNVYSGLGAPVVEEYESMAFCDSQRNAVVPRFEPRSFGALPGLLGSGDARGRWNHLNAYVH